MTYNGTDYNDTVHPNESGHIKMKNAVYTAIYG